MQNSNDPTPTPPLPGSIKEREPSIVSFASSAFFVSETGESLQPITLSRTGSSHGTLSVEIKIASSQRPGRITGGIDYVNGSLLCEWADGDMTTKRLDWKPNLDRVHEGYEVASLSLVIVSGNAIKGDIKTATLIIEDVPREPDNFVTMEAVEVYDAGYQVGDITWYRLRFLEPRTIKTIQIQRETKPCDWYPIASSPFPAIIEPDWNAIETRLLPLSACLIRVNQINSIAKTTKWEGVIHFDKSFACFKIAIGNRDVIQ